MKQTFGQKAVGLNFNPSGNDKVDKAKQLCAELIDLVEEDYNSKEAWSANNSSWTTNVLRTAAFNALIAAQMTVVKFLTWKN